MINKISGLYVIIDPSHTNGRPPESVAKDVCEGGADIIQYRNKFESNSKILEEAKRIKEIANYNKTLFIINDRVDLALIIKADGIHVGRNDESVKNCRLILGPNSIIGNSNATNKEVEISSSLDLNYIAIGSLFETKTKKDTIPSSLEIIKKLKNSGFTKPIVGIGGINKERIKSVLQSGADCVCITSAITLSNEPKLETKDFQEIIEHYKNEKR